MVLLENIRRGSFAYIELDEEGIPTEWLTEMENQAALPLMVQADFEMNQDAREKWPLLQIALQVDSSSTSGNRSSVMNMLQSRNNREKN